ncbi:MAG: TM0106 family RecB-like putative nuclease [Richelia sp. RM2_1_2]|nr:TM0106 family RecB-like putative nuclease [Richelia sp. SM1_7_0]NJN06709.1 TM0106 family RecB-like putative nuclease [Richelia sp. RM1_1_1]NJO28386.1 TM0106 family RecB-like putative nuclease [Richelia sp. SL_2_1]NJO58272.1 TM0106 family RecB-like putative nuclease [Richelia sp. RM2_1_2]
MLINAELLLQYQKCKRRPFLNVRGDKNQQDAPSDLLLKLYQDKYAHKKHILEQISYQRPKFSKGEPKTAEAATLELMQQGVEYIYKGILTTSYADNHTLLARPDLLIKQPGNSIFGDWMYVPARVELGKRPKQEYQVIAAFYAFVLEAVQQVELETAWLMLRGKETRYNVDLVKWIPRMQEILDECIQTLYLPTPPEVFISRQKCSLCNWYSSCHQTASTQKHLSLVPGVTPGRYDWLKILDITTLESLTQTNPSELEDLPGFDTEVATQLVLQGKSLLENRPLFLPQALVEQTITEEFATTTHQSLLTLPNDNAIIERRSPSIQYPTIVEIDPVVYETVTYTAPIELYFDIEAQPDLNLNYLLGVLVVDREQNTQQFYSFLAENPEEEKLIWQQFLELVWQYPDAPIYHFCVYEFDTVQRLAKLHRTPSKKVFPVLNRFVDIYEQLTATVTLPVESYALKAIARWMGFEWRDPEASGAKCIYWYDRWLKTGDRALLEVIKRYNEDDCRATHSVKDWLVNFFESQYNDS